jgi:hypothetical protein
MLSLCINIEEKFKELIQVSTEYKVLGINYKICFKVKLKKYLNAKF